MADNLQMFRVGQTSQSTCNQEKCTSYILVNSVTLCLSKRVGAADWKVSD